MSSEFAGPVAGTCGDFSGPGGSVGLLTSSIFASGWHSRRIGSCLCLERNVCSRIPKGDVVVAQNGGASFHSHASSPKKFLNGVSCRPGWLHTHCVAKAGLEFLIHSHPSAGIIHMPPLCSANIGACTCVVCVWTSSRLSRVLGLSARATKRIF